MVEEIRYMLKIGKTLSEISEEMKIEIQFLRIYTRLILLENKIHKCGNEILIQKFSFLGLNAEPFLQIDKDVDGVCEVLEYINRDMSKTEVDILVKSYRVKKNKMGKDYAEVVETAKLIKENEEVLKDKKRKIKQSVKIFDDMFKYIEENSDKENMPMIEDSIGVWKNIYSLKMKLNTEAYTQLKSKRIISNVEKIVEINLPKEFIIYVNKKLNEGQNIWAKEEENESGIITNLYVEPVSLGYVDALKNQLHNIKIREEQLKNEMRILEKHFVSKWANMDLHLFSKEAKKISQENEIYKKIQFKLIKYLRGKGYIATNNLIFAGVMVSVAGYNSEETIAIITTKVENTEVLENYVNRIYSLDSRDESRGFGTFVIDEEAVKKTESEYFEQNIYSTKYFKDKINEQNSNIMLLALNN